MKILIVGANSAVAKSVIPVLSSDHEVITAGRSGCDINYDVIKGGNISQQVDVVINFAAAFGGTGDEDITNTLQTNVVGMFEVCKMARNAEATHIIDISSIFAALSDAELYGSAYALTKRQADEIATLYCSVNEIPLTILRPARIYGNSDDFLKHQPFLYQMFNSAKRGEDINLYGKVDPKRNYIHILDLAEIIKRVVNKKIHGVFSCVSLEDTSYGSIAQTAQAIFGKGGEVKFIKDKPDIKSDEFPIDVSLYELTGYYPTVTIEKGIEMLKVSEEA